MRAVVVVSLAVALAVATAAHAEPCAPTDELTAARLRFVRAHADRAAHRARVWTWTWTAIHTGIIAGSLALVPVTDPTARVDRYVAASAAAVGLASTWIVRPHVQREASAIARDDGCDVGAHAEHALADWADDDRKSRAWPVHVASTLFNLGMGAVLGFGYHRWPSAALQAFGGIAVAEVQIWTRPVDSRPALARYRAGEIDVAVTPLGLSLAATF